MRRSSPSAVALTFLLVAVIVSGAPVKATDETSIVSRIKRVPVESTALAAVGYC
jgi:hypothetical protein